jgi:hypothetical protein
VPPPRRTTPGRTPAALEGLLRFFVASPAAQDGSAGGEGVPRRAADDANSGEPPVVDDPSVAGDLPAVRDDPPLSDGAISGGEVPLGKRGRPDRDRVTGGRRRRKRGRSGGASDRSLPDQTSDARSRPEPDRSIGERRRDGRGDAGGRGPRIVVVGGASDVRAAAGVIASRVAAARGCATGVVVSWTAPVAAGEGDDARPPHGGLVLARAGAVRLAAELAERGHDARASGRLVQVRLGEGPGAVAEAERVQDAAGDAPVVLALEGARGQEWDRMLPAQDLVLLAAGPRVPEALAAVALGAAQDRCDDTPVRLLAVSAGRRPRPARAALAEVVALLEAR